MKITRYMGAFAVIAMLAACSTDDEQGANSAANEVKIAATVGENSIFTRSNPVGKEAEQESFNENDAISVTFSSLGNVGPALGNSIGPTDSWHSLPTLGKWIASTLMLIGRLEIFSVLIIFTPTFWKEN